MSLDSPKTTEEHYTAAVGHGQLTVDLARRTPADYIIASGMSGAHLGAALINLRSEYDRAARQVYKPGDTPGSHELALHDFYRCLKSYNSVYAMLVDQAKGGRINTHIPAALAYWLSSNCPICTGRGVEIVAGTKRTNGRCCKPCQGTGVKHLSSPVARKILNIIDSAIAGHRGACNRKLKDQKFEENVAYLP